MKAIRFEGKKAFRILWAGQAVSFLGTGMTRFTVMIWAFQQTGSATTLALLGFFSCLTFILASPFAGVLVDRWDRRMVMFVSDLCAGSMTALLLALNVTGNLQIWHLYLAEGMTGLFEAFQDPAFSASISMILPKEEYTRANGLLGLGKSAARLLAPSLAGLLLQVDGLTLVMGADLATLTLALLGLLLVHIPRPQSDAAGQRVTAGFWSELRFGAKYILSRPGLRNLTLTFFLVNLFGTLTYFAVLSPMILARTGGDEMSLGIVRTVMGVGGVAGGVLISLWGGPRRKVRTYLIATAASFLICDFLTAVSRSPAGWSVAGFLSELSIPFIVAPYFALWQEIVPPEVQGRVFSTREMVQIGAQPIGYLLGGILADRLFEPAMMSGPLAGIVGGLLGTGPGTGMAAMFLCTSLLGGLTGLLGLLSPSIRRLEES